MEELSRILVGQTESHVVPWRETKFRVHRNMYTALESLARAAQIDGITISLASAYRSFDRQLTIWNAKATGQRPILDDNGLAVDSSQLNRRQLLSAILRWSALPGTSRHHWGTDIDVYDAAAVPEDYQVQLTPEESTTHFARLHNWLNKNMARFGFFRPYARDLGGIAPELWHLSFQPVARAYMEVYSLAGLEQTLRSVELELKDEVLENLPQIFDRYVLRICAP